MTGTYKIRFTYKAWDEFDRILEYIDQQSPQNAKSVRHELLTEIGGLQLMPDRFRKVGKSRSTKSPVHALTVRPFIVYYRIEGNFVYVVSIKHGAQRQPRRFD
jgi:plasmid stabilization system protein ParE